MERDWPSQNMQPDLGSALSTSLLIIVKNSFVTTSAFVLLTKSVHFIHFALYKPLDAYLFTTQSRIQTTMKKKPFGNTVGKGEMLVHSIFFFSHHVLYPIKNRNNNFSNIYRLQML